MTTLLLIYLFGVPVVFVGLVAAIVYAKAYDERMMIIPPAMALWPLTVLVALGIYIGTKLRNKP